MSPSKVFSVCALSEAKSMPYQSLINALKNRIKLSNASEISSTTTKEGQCDGDEEKMCELDATNFKRENAEMLE